MLRKLLLGAGIGAISSSCCAISSSAADAPVLDEIMDPTKDAQPIRCVVIGGGLSGSRVAYQLDSIVDVTLIDTKNFYETTSDIIPIITTTPWGEKNEEACKKLHALHRYYLKRANVLTATASSIDEASVTLSDGRKVPYDLAFIAVGETKPFPFESKQKSITARVAELKAFNEYLSKMKKVAIVGGGPMGVSLAAQLGEDRPDLEVHLFHSGPSLLPRLPDLCGEYALEHLKKKPSIHVHLGSEVVNIRGSGRALESTAAPAAAKATSWWSRFFVRSSSDSAALEPPTQFSLDVQALEFEALRKQSVISQLYFGRRRTRLRSAVKENQAFNDFDHVFSLGGDTPRPLIDGKQVPMLVDHVMADGHLRVSTLLQLFGHPNLFATGRCNNISWVKGMGSSDTQSRHILRLMNIIVNSPSQRLLRSSDGLQLERQSVPRLMIRLGNMDACGSTPWGGALTGVNALRELIHDRGQLLREFSSLVFFKRQNPAKVAERITDWMSNEITDITDFSHAN